MLNDELEILEQKKNTLDQSVWNDCEKTLNRMQELYNWLDEIKKFAPQGSIIKYKHKNDKREEWSTWY